jgi:hypothetical protein
VKRRLLNLLTALSLSLLALVLLSWLRSYLPRDFQAASHNGRLLLLFTEEQWSEFVQARDRTPGYDRIWASATNEAAKEGSVLGVAYLVKSTPTSPTSASGMRIYGRFVMLAVPYPYLLLASGAAAAWSVHALRRHRRRSRAGECANCGYDLRATPDRCPECGWSAPVTTTT